jgi:hypothetical protein
LQPHVVVLCEELSKLDAVGGSIAFSVIQSNLFYEMPSVAAAVDTCLKACFVFNLSYPHAAKSSWVYIHCAVYDISTEMDDLGSKVPQLLADCKR